jgi:hypothetical protein
VHGPPMWKLYVLLVPDRSIWGQLVRQTLANKVGSVYCSHVISVYVVAVAVHTCDISTFCNECVHGLGSLDLTLGSRTAKPNK